MAEMQKNLPKRAGGDSKVRHSARRARSWRRGEDRKESRRKAQDKREQHNRTELADLAQTFGLRPKITKEVIRNGRTETRRVQPSKALRKMRRELSRRNAA